MGIDMTQRQGYGETRAAAQRTLHLHLASVKFHKSLDKRQTDARPGGIYLLHLVEPVEDVFQVVLTDSIAVVLNENGHGVDAGEHPEGYVAVVGRVLDCV